MSKEMPDYERRLGEILEKAYKWECEKEGVTGRMTKEEFHELILRAEEMRENGIKL